MNLITDAWIPTDIGEVSIVDALAEASSTSWGRGDWDAATLHMLIGLMQTVVTLDEVCASESDWSKLLAAPPSRDELSDWLSPLVSAFSGKVFEDTDELEGATEVPIAYLLPECPKGNTLKKCSDIGQWADNAEQFLTDAEARIALYSDAVWGMGIGAGFRQGPRAGSKMTVFVEPIREGGLWERVWLNVLPKRRWVTHYGNAAYQPERVFPWLSSCLDRQVTPEATHPLLIYWTIPRRNRLVMDQGAVRQYRRVPGGPQYVGWCHPLSPYRQTDEGPVALRIAPGHLGYGDWVGLTIDQPDNTSPSLITNEFVQHRLDDDYFFRLRCVGWASKSAEAHAWIEHTVPLIKDADAEVVLDLLDAAEKERKKLTSALFLALTGTGTKDQRNGTSRRAGNQLYASTEQTFYQRVRQGSMEDWDIDLRKSARAIFDDIVERFDCDPIEVAKQRVKI